LPVFIADFYPFDSDFRTFIDELTDIKIAEESKKTISGGKRNI